MFALSSSRRALEPLRLVAPLRSRFSTTRFRRSAPETNRVGTNFPFAYEGKAARRKFTVVYWSLLGVGFFVIPGVAVAFQLVRPLFPSLPFPLERSRSGGGGC
ncbi:hypothetical protein JCM5296_007346 [Sporobolomyces johnsonii]